MSHTANRKKARPTHKIQTREKTVNPLSAATGTVWWTTPFAEHHGVRLTPSSNGINRIQPSWIPKTETTPRRRSSSANLHTRAQQPFQRCGSSPPQFRWERVFPTPLHIPSESPPSPGSVVRRIINSVVDLHMNMLGPVGPVASATHRGHAHPSTNSTTRLESCTWVFLKEPSTTSRSETSGVLEVGRVQISWWVPVPRRSRRVLEQGGVRPFRDDPRRGSELRVFPVRQHVQPRGHQTEVLRRARMSLRNHRHRRTVHPLARALHRRVRREVL